MKLLVTDYDNILELHYEFTDNIEILNRNIKSLNRFMKENIVCIATGRHFDAIYRTLIENKIKFNYLCANNGAELYDNKYNLIYCLPLEESNLKVLMSLNEFVFFRHPFKNNFASSANLYIENEDKYNELKEYLNNNLRNSLIEYKFPKIKIINKKCNNVNTIDVILTKEKILAGDVYTIGDDINDLDMIVQYNGASLITSNEKVKNVSFKLFKELNNFIDFIDENKKD